VNPVTAAHNNRLYGGPQQTIDDLLPTTLVWYASPCEASAAYTALAERMPDNKLYASRSRTCESLPAPHAAVSAGAELAIAAPGYRTSTPPDSPAVY
jgi:hypothetical protein